MKMTVGQQSSSGGLGRETCGTTLGGRRSPTFGSWNLAFWGRAFSLQRPTEKRGPRVAHPALPKRKRAQTRPLLLRLFAAMLKLTNSGHPRVDQRNREIIKVRRIASCQRGMTGKHEASDHRVTQFTRATFPVSRRHEVARLLRRRDIEGSDSMRDLVENSFERLNQ